MSETPTGTDRVQLTETERALMNCDCADPYTWDDHVDSCTVPVVESIVAARTADLRRWKSEAIEVIYGLQELGKALDLPLGERITGPKAVEAVQALTDERDELRASLPKRTRDWLAHCKVLDAERDAVSDQLAEAWKQLGETEAQLAAANARCAELEAAIEQEIATRDQYADLLDRFAAAIPGDHGEHSSGNDPWTNALASATALQATLDRVTEWADVLDKEAYAPDRTVSGMALAMTTAATGLRAALTPEGTE